jgi:multidrug efflux system membrane fusion protein
MRAVVLLALVLGAGGYFGWRYIHDDDRARAAASAAAGDSHPPAIPVTVAAVRKADFPVYLNGLGTVQPFDTVTVRSRVDGQVVKVDFEQGQMVKQGDVLLEIDPRPYKAVLDQAAAKKAQDQASLKNAQLDLQRYSSLAKESFASRQQFDTQQALVEQLTAQIAGDQAAIDNAQTQLDYTTIRSPLTGKTGFRLIDPGNIVHAADAGGIVTIVRLQPISVVFTAPEDELPRINQALAAGSVPVEALSSNGQKSLSKGTLTLVNNAVDQASGTISMKATFANADSALWPGLSVSTRLLIDTLKQATVVPESAVQRGQNGLYAFVVGDANRVEVRSITVDQEGHGQSVVSQGLSAGEKVVTAGQYRLTQGALVSANAAGAQDAPETMAQNETGKAQ